MDYKLARQIVNGESYDPAKNYTGIDTSKPYIKYSGTIPVGYEDVTSSLKNIEDFYLDAGCDFITMRRMMITFTTSQGGFNLLASEEEKEIAKVNIAIDESSVAEKLALITYLLLSEVGPVDPLNPTDEEISAAKALYVSYKSEQMYYASKAANDRVYKDGLSINPELSELALLHIHEDEVGDALDNIKAFLPKYAGIGWFGVKYGDPTVGFADYINDENNYAPNTGLWSFATNAPDGSDQATIDGYKTQRRIVFDTYLFQ